LTLAVHKALRGSGRGDRRSRRRGASPEFAQHRAYSTGDDLRHVDWAVYARLGELFLKEHSAEQDLNLYLLLDTSASMGLHGKLPQACRLAATFAYIGLASGDRVRLQCFADGAVRPALGPLRGRRGLRPLLEFLSALEASGATGFEDCVRRFCARSQSPGLVLCISDLLAPDSVDDALGRLAASTHEALVLHVMAEAELDPELDPELGGEVELRCVEADERVSMTLDGVALERYRQRVRGFLAKVEARCRKGRLRYLRCLEHEDVAELVFRGARERGFFMP
jgi:uncharacterized protein (DUF58 family)